MSERSREDGGLCLADLIRDDHRKPETMEQARTWDKTKSLYLRDGLCHVCAAQAAWGHQLGFRRVKSPCSGCVLVVAGFPVVKANGWRGFPCGHHRAEGSRSGIHPRTPGEAVGPFKSAPVTVPEGFTAVAEREQEREHLAEVTRSHAHRARRLRDWTAAGKPASAFLDYENMTAREISVAIGWVPWPEKWPA